MIKKFKIAALTAAMAVSFSAQAGSFWFDADGAAGAGQAVLVDNYLGFGGELAVEVNYNPSNPNPFAFGFTQWGTGSVQNVSGTSLFDFDPVTGSALGHTRFSLTGTGSGVLGGGLSFAGGTLQMYNPNFSNSIATFAITGGGTPTINTDGSVTSGTTDTYAKLTSAAAGYFFLDVSGVKGNDLTSPLVAQSVRDTTTMWLSTNLTIQKSLSGITNALGKIDDKFTTLPVTVGDFTDAPGGPVSYESLDAYHRPTNLVFAAAGQDYVSVPEPTSLALVGLGLLAAGALRRRKTAVAV